MARVRDTEDYYKILQVKQDAAIETIRESYKRLALKHHPDRDSGQDTTVTFQLLQRAYETLKDEAKRRAYDFLYPSIAQRTRAQPNESQPRPSRDPKPTSEVHSEAAQISEIEKGKQQRQWEWQIKKQPFESAIFKLQMVIRRVDREMQDLSSIIAADAAEQSWERSWGAWILSPIYRKAEATEDEKETKEKQRQERIIQRDMKERRLDSAREECRKREIQLDSAGKEVETADMIDDAKIRSLQHQIRRRDDRERGAKEKAKREEEQRIRKQQQEQREKRNRWARANMDGIIYTTPEGLLCTHGDWWQEIRRRAPCSKCSDVWTYLLECPGCKMKACPKCKTLVCARWGGRRPASSRTRPTPASYYYRGFDD
ncbi:DnaJ domain-containing protein [Xylariaceae sp. FL1272]|nr:DnaJ domain-containing protein [Xylariaceae sp. FL1272]